MKLNMTRRFFLKSSGIALIGLGTVPSFLRRAVAATTDAKGKILIVIFQRGAADGLNIVVPHGETSYYQVRPTIAIPRPASGDRQAVIDLDGFFGLHPALAPFKKLYDEGLLAVVHAAGSPDSTRSHFDAQDFMESGTPGIKSTADGWLNRYLRTKNPIAPSQFRAVSLTSQLPRTLRGPAPALAIPSVNQFGIRAGRYTDVVRDGLEAMYANAPDPLLANTAKETFEAMQALERIHPGQYEPAAGVEYPRGPLAEGLRQIAQLIKANLGVEVAFAEAGGWDHHVNEGGSSGQLSNLLGQFGQAISALTRDLGDRMQDVVIVTMSEFGRTVAENGNRGTDHGHANAMFVVGGPVRGGKVYAQWPGLKREQLFEGRDLALTTDYRHVLGEILQRHLGSSDLPAVFPNTTITAANFRGLVRS